MRHLIRYIFLTTLLLNALKGEAVQLGAVKGSAIFGRPLDLSVKVRLDAPAEDAANCFSAEVFQADNNFDAGRVRIDVSPAANGLDATVRVRSATAVNEPWAKVILRSNCGAKVSRQYDFLTDFATDISAGNLLANTTPNLPETSTIVTSPTATSSAQAPASNLNEKSSQTKVKASQQKPNTQIAQSHLTPQKTKSIAPVPAIAANGSKKTTEIVAGAMGQSRLKMEAFELTDERQVLLKLSTALIAPVGIRTSEEKQALAQATAVWRSINGMPSEIKATETPAVAATQVTVPAVVTPPVTMPTLKNQKFADKSEFSNLMVYGLFGLLALTLGCIAWLWLRVKKATRASYGWLNDSAAEDAFADHEPTQFLQTNFYETEIAADAQEELEPKLNLEPEQALEQTVELEPEIVIEIEDLHDQERSVAAATKSDSPLVNSMLGHFDAPRFDERVLRVKNKDLNLTDENTITASAELMDLALEDPLVKHRSVAAPAPEPLNIPSSINASEAVIAQDVKDTKEDLKGNLIDFDIFAEPGLLNNPKRFRS